MSVGATIVSVLLGVAFLLAGLPKTLRTAHYRDRVATGASPTEPCP